MNLLTLIVPTRNRPKFLARMLSYYSEVGFSCKIIVADSSEEVILEQNRHVIGHTKGLFAIEHRTYDGNSTLAAKINNSLNCVDTRYVVLGADDDFFVPRALDRATEFLENQPDYSLAHGGAVSFELKSDKDPVCGEILKVVSYNQRSIEFADASRRLSDHLADYCPTFYSVQRLDQMRSIWLKTYHAFLDPYFGELLPSCLSLIQGKSKRLKGLYMARQTHSAKGYLLPDLFDWFIHPDWGKQYETLRDIIAEELAQYSPLVAEEAKTFFKGIFWHYMAQSLSNHHCWRYPVVAQNNTVKYSLRGKIKYWYEHFTENNPIRKSFPDYADFQPVYRAVAQKNLAANSIMPNFKGYY